MPKGFGFVERAAKETAARGGSSIWAGKLLFKLPDDGDQAFGRFITNEPDGDEDDFIYSAWHHEVPVEGRAWGDQIPCLAQDEDGNRTEDECPGCEADLPFKFKGFVKLIWRDAPVYKKDEKGKIVKDNTGDFVVLERRDQIAIWSSGPRLFEELGETNESYNGLGSRDFRIKRRGTGTDTKYSIVPADIDGGKQPLKASDKKLIKADEIDLAEFIRPPSLENWRARMNGPGASGNGRSSGGSDEASSQAASNNPFKRRR